ncbi:hypothetical protein [Chryseobacterium vrystaatense]|uniref:DUF3592 domain-containing protein n=1 Tax=Chryseobacterium vrystaatense TaxID=307480 RepID=A0ABR4UQ72_9FLAO|nr:hypothetical protein [Chryseobacterium vrystaatense]KFF27266.1 hypothetical protein IW16_08420 [Chryseobacterium vrystaatense]
MKQKFYKSQILIIFIIILGLGLTLKQFDQYKQAMNENNILNEKVIKQNCHSAPRMKSTVWINANKKVYSIEVPYDKCVNYPIGSYIKAFYSANNDEFIYEVTTPKYSKNIVLLVICLLIALLPWRYINKKWFVKG